MATNAQVLANRENAQHSTGPKTEEGKAASSQNRLLHGLAAADPVLPTEDRDQFNQLLATYTSELRPTNTHEEFLVSEMTGARWKLNRIKRLEVDMLAALAAPGLAFTDKETAAGFTRLERYRAGLERTYQRCAREIRQSQKFQNEPKSRETIGRQDRKLLERFLNPPLPRLAGMHLKSDRPMRSIPNAEEPRKDCQQPA